jgi:hypothetical protein
MFTEHYLRLLCGYFKCKVLMLSLIDAAKWHSTLCLLMRLHPLVLQRVTLEGALSVPAAASAASAALQH